jgi:hypothetical protein
MSSLAEIGQGVLINPELPWQAAGVGVSTPGQIQRRHDSTWERTKLDNRVVQSLAQRLAEVAFTLWKQPGEFVFESVNRADLPDAWKRDLCGRVTGSFDDASRYLVRALLEKGLVPGERRVSALALFLAANAEGFGLDDRELFCRVIGELRNPEDNTLIALICGREEGAE